MSGGARPRTVYLTRTSVVREQAGRRGSQEVDASRRVHPPGMGDDGAAAAAGWVWREQYGAALERITRLEETEDLLAGSI